MNWRGTNLVTTKIAVATALCGMAAAAQAQASPAAPLPEAAQHPHAQVRESDGARSMSGGIGQSEQRRMRKAADDYSLALTFSARSGHYLADVDVEVKDRSGDVVYSKGSTGPMVLVDLPPGRYTVEAVHEGHAQRRDVVVAASGTRSVILSWSDAFERGA